MSECEVCKVPVQSTANQGGRGRNTYLGAHTEQGAHGESPRRKTFGFVLPLGNVTFVRLGFLLSVFDGDILTVVGLEDRANVLGFVNSNG